MGSYLPGTRKCRRQTSLSIEHGWGLLAHRKDPNDDEGTAETHEAQHEEWSSSKSKDEEPTTHHCNDIRGHGYDIDRIGGGRGKSSCFQELDTKSKDTVPAPVLQTPDTKHLRDISLHSEPKQLRTG